MPCKRESIAAVGWASLKQEAQPFYELNKSKGI